MHSFPLPFTVLCLVVLNLFCLSIQQSSTGSACDESGDSVKFEQGQSYKYDFSSVVSQHFRHGENGLSNLVINADVFLTKKAPCEYILSLEKLAVVNRDGKGPKISENSNTAVRFTRRNGVVDEFFISEKDDIWSANVKRAVVSMFQNKAFQSETVTTTMEASLSGNCPTTHFKSGDKYIKQIYLNECLQRERTPKAYLGTPYEVPTGVQHNSLHMLNSSSFCEQAVASGVIQSVTCSEEHQLCHHHHNCHSMGTKVKSSLKLSMTEATKFSAAQLEQLTQDTKLQSNIIFDQTQRKISVNNENAEKNIEDKVKTILLHLEADIDQGEYYMQLLEALKELENPTELYSGKDYIMTKKAKVLFLDAMAETDTIAALLFMSKLIEGDATAVPDKTKITFYKKLSYSAEPKAEGLEALESLVKTRVDGETSSNSQKRLDRHLMFGASGYAHRFCNFVGDSCGESPVYMKLCDTIANFSIDSEVKESNSRNAIVATIHSLGNFHKLTAGAVTKILQYLNSAQKDWVKILAMQAFRSEPCQKELKENVRAIVENITLSQDLRIHAYLAMSRCFVNEDLAAVEKTFKDPSSTSVARFIISHVQNIRDSSSPSKTKLKNSLAQIKLPENFSASSSATFSSVYHEYSAFCNEKNVGISAEAIFVFEEGSEVPLAITLGLTVDAIGRSYNVFEAAISRRTIKEMDISVFNSSFKAIARHFGLLLLESSRRNDAHFRMFGITTRMGDIREASSKLLSLFSQALNEAQVTSEGVEVVQANTLTFLDLEFSYPTISGFPLTLDFQGTLIHALKMNNITGTMYLAGLRLDPINAVANTQCDLRNSASITVKSAMQVGRPHFTPMNVGILKDYALDTLLEMGVDLDKEQLNKIHMTIRLTKDNFGTVRLSKTSFFYEDIDGVFSRVPYSKDSYSAEKIQLPFCHKSTEYSSGVVLCSALHFPSNGIDKDAMQYNLTFVKLDKSMKGFELKWDINHNGNGNNSWSLVMDTPGSATFRKVTVEYKGELNNTELIEHISRTLELTSPWRNISCNGYRAMGPTDPSHTKFITEGFITAQISDIGTYKLNYTKNTLAKDFDNAKDQQPDRYMPYSGISEYEYGLQLTFPTDRVMVNANAFMHQNISQRNKNYNYSLSYGGELLKNAGIGGNIQASCVTQPDASSTHELNTLKLTINTEQLSNVDLQINATCNYEKYSDKDVRSSLQFMNKMYSYNYSTSGSSEYSEEKKRALKGHYTLNSSYSESPGNRRSTLNSYYDFDSLANGTDTQDVSATIITNDLKTSEYVFKAESRSEALKTTALMQLNEKEGEQIANMDGEIVKSAETNKTDVKVAMLIKSVLDFKSNVEMTKTDISGEMTAQLLKSGCWANHTVKASSQGDLFTRHSAVFWGHKETTEGSVICDATVNTAVRSLEAKSVGTIGKKTFTVTTKGAVAQDILNGHSDIVTVLALSSGENIRKLVEIDTKNDQDGQTSSATLHYLVEDTASRSFEPLELTWKSATSWKNKQPTEMNFTHSFTNDLKYNRGCPKVGDKSCKDMHLVTDLSTSQTAANDLFTAAGSLKSEGNILVKDLAGSFEVAGPATALKNHGVIRINGSSQNTDKKEVVTTSVTYDLPDSFENIWKSRSTFATFIISEIDLKSGVASVLLDGEVNSTTAVKSWTNFEMTDTGRISAQGNTTTYAELVRLHDNEFLLHYDVTQNAEILALVEVMIKLRRENEQLRLEFNSKNNIKDYKPSQFNFTLTR